MRIDIDPSDEEIVASISEDRAGRNEDLQWFIRLLDRTKGPYTYMIDAPWGDGKTFFLKSAQLVLEAKNSFIDVDEGVREGLAGFLAQLDDVEEPFLPVYFNAWENDFAEDPMVALLANMAVKLKQMDFCKETDVVRAVASIIDAALGVAGRDGGMTAMVDELRGSSLIEEYERRATVREQIRQLAEVGMREVANKLVIFIDELDRCRPDFAVRLLEQTKRLFNSDRVILVFATDSRRLAEAVGGMYGPGFESERFLERFFDSRLRLSTVDAFRVATSRPLDLTHAFDLLFNEVSSKEHLTMRDMCHIQPRFDDAKRYCLQRLDRNNAFVTSVRCAILPLLIVLERIEPKLFAQIVSGNDPNALYEYGKQFDGFNAIIGGLPQAQALTDGLPVDVESYERSFMQHLCTFIYGDPNIVDTYSAAAEIGLTSEALFNKKAFKRLIFDDVLY